jgi:ferrous iron transport protein B
VKELIVAVVGNPNSGKTTFFNGLTGSSQRVGNWPGVTVEKKEGYFTHNDVRIKVVDLPGIYALSAGSEDERISLRYILSGEIDLLVNIIDATNIERNLYLTAQLAEMKMPMVVIVNMLDIAHGRSININLEELSKWLGCPVFGMSAIKKNSAEAIKKNIVECVEKKPVPTLEIPYPLHISEWLDGNCNSYAKTAEVMEMPARWIALRVLENTKDIIHNAIANKELDEKKLKESLSLPGMPDAPEIVIAESRYYTAQNISNAVRKLPKNKVTLSDRIDSIILNRVLGIPIFLMMMYLVFWLTMSIGGSFIDFFDIFFSAVFVDGFGLALSAMEVPAWLVTLLASGIGTGITTVTTFIPIVFMLFLCLSILEDSGYMARAAFVMDRFMRTIGLPGKSFVPMLVGFGCTVPAAMAARTLDSPRDRILTVFITPFMSCGARLPVYALFGAAFFGANAGLMVFSLYIAGGVLAILTGLLMKNTLLKGEPSYFIMELPPYHAPHPSAILRSAWGRLKTFLVRAGKIIIIAAGLLGFLNSIGTDGSFGNEDAGNSVLSAIGQTITPVFKPMGVDEKNWPATVALFTGLFAKEAIVATLNSLYSQIDTQEVSDATAEEAAFNLADAAKEALATIPANLLEAFGGRAVHETKKEDVIFASMHKYFDKGLAQVYAYLIFILLYVPCVAAVGTIAREIGGKMTVIMLVYLTALAWAMGTLVYQIGTGHEPLWIAFTAALLSGTAVGLRILGKIRERENA